MPCGKRAFMSRDWSEADPGLGWGERVSLTIEQRGHQGAVGGREALNLVCSL